MPHSINLVCHTLSIFRFPYFFSRDKQKALLLLISTNICLEIEYTCHVSSQNYISKILFDAEQFGRVDMAVLKSRHTANTCDLLNFQS